jgi:hypothetical protein
MNTQLNELREKMIHETEEFLDVGLQHDSHAPRLSKASSFAATRPHQEWSDDRPYFFPPWREWTPASQLSAQ